MSDPHDIKELSPLALPRKPHEGSGGTVQLSQQVYADMMEVIKTFATESFTQYACDGWYDCPFCDGGSDSGQEDNVKHKETCIITKARKVMDT